jgi:hypothetical protein
MLFCFAFISCLRLIDSISVWEMGIIIWIQYPKFGNIPISHIFYFSKNISIFTCWFNNMTYFWLFFELKTNVFVRIWSAMFNMSSYWRKQDNFVKHTNIMFSLCLSLAYSLSKLKYPSFIWGIFSIHCFVKHWKRISR